MNFPSCASCFLLPGILSDPVKLDLSFQACISWHLLFRTIYFFWGQNWFPLLAVYPYQVMMITFVTILSSFVILFFTMLSYLRACLETSATFVLKIVSLYEGKAVFQSTNLWDHFSTEHEHIALEGKWCGKKGSLSQPGHLNQQGNR